jgi:hypothetical protein
LTHRRAAALFFYRLRGTVRQAPNADAEDAKDAEANAEKMEERTEIDVLPRRFSRRGA